MNARLKTRAFLRPSSWRPAAEPCKFIRCQRAVAAHPLCVSPSDAVFCCGVTHPPAALSSCPRGSAARSPAFLVRALSDSHSEPGM